MATLNRPYVTLDEFKASQKKVSAERDDAIALALSAASDQIDAYCGRTFSTVDVATPRVFTADRYSLVSGIRIWGSYGGSGIVTVDEFHAIEGIAFGPGDGTFPIPSDLVNYDLPPVPLAIPGIVVYDRIYAKNGAFPNDRNTIQVTAKWGWPEVPAIIKQVCSQMANRMVTVLDAPFGQAGSGELGQIQSANALTPMLASELNAWRVMPV